MADDEREDNIDAQEEEEEDEWLEPVDLSTIPDGPTTTFVGGFSTIQTVDEGLVKLKQPNDNLVILPGTYTTEVVTLDTTKLLGVDIRGDATAGRGDIIIDGQLVLEYSAPVPQAAADPNDEEAEEGAAKPEPPKLLSISHLTFLKGAVYNTQSAATVDDVVFGTATRSHPVDHCLQCHGFSTVSTSNSTVFGSGSSAAYFFPHSRVEFAQCDFIGAETPPPAVEGERKVRKRGAAPPVIPPPTTPTKCECDVGIYLDNGSAKFEECNVKSFDIGILANDVCPKANFNNGNVSLISTVGILLENGSTATVRSSNVKMCGRETIVLGSKTHPIVRDNNFIGDVRLKSGSIATGVTDNLVGLNGVVHHEESKFQIKGLTVVPHDPSLIKVRKAPVEEE